jgi:tetratricopeptide (TPR) repeat protein
MPEGASAKSSRTIARLQRVRAMVDNKLDDPRLALDVLVRDAGIARAHPELWEGLHDAAVRDDRLLELGTAYEEIVRRRDLAQVPVETQVELFFQAATFFSEILGDQDAAQGFLSRAVELDPTHTAAFEKLEKWLHAANDTPRIADLYATAAAAKTDRTAQMILMRKAMTLVEGLPTSELEKAIRVLEKLNAIEPANPWYRIALETRYTRARRFPDLAALLEKALAAVNSEDEQHALRVRLIPLYIGEAGTPEKAIGHVEEVLRRDPQNEVAHKGCDALLKYSSVAKRAADALQERRRRLAAARP